MQRQMSIFTTNLLEPSLLSSGRVQYIMTTPIAHIPVEGNEIDFKHDNQML